MGVRDTSEERIPRKLKVDERLQARLWPAIEGRRPFRCFKDVLADYSAEREWWFRFKDNRIRARMLEWLEDEGIELVGE